MSKKVTASRFFFRELAIPDVTVWEFRNDCSMSVFSNQFLVKVAKSITVSLTASLLVWLPAIPASAHQSPIDCSSLSLIGDGTLGNPIQIGTPSDLLAIDDCLDLDPSNQDVLFELTASIDMSGVGEITPLRHFAGELDGANHQITGLSISGNITSSHAALFATAAGNVRIKNLYITGSVENDSGSTGYSSLLFGQVDGELNVYNTTISGTITEATPGSTFAAGLLAAEVSGSADVFQVEVVGGTISATAMYAGGLIGKGDTVYMGSVQVFDLTIDSPSQNQGYYGGALGGALDATNNQWDSIQIENLNIRATSGRAGGVVGDIQNSELDINWVSLTASSIAMTSGSIGGVAGGVGGNGSVRHLELGNVYFETSGSHVGGAFGSVAGNLSSRDNDLAQLDISTSASSNYIAGIAGEVTGDVYAFNNTIVGLTILNSSAFVGGIVGYCQEGSFSGDSLLVANSSFTTNGSNSFVGGLAGSVSGSFVVEFATVESVTISAGGSFAGGYLGYSSNGGFEAYITDLIDVQVMTPAGAQGNYFGGYLGNAQESVTISFGQVSMIEVVADGGFIGGFAGMVTDGDLTVDNISISQIVVINDGNSAYTAGLAGSVGGNFNLETVDAEYLWVEGYNGFTAGLVGKADGGASISDLVTFETHVETPVQNISYTGGLIGLADWVSVTDSRFENGEVLSDGDWVGGLVGATTAAGQTFSRVVLLAHDIEGVGRVGGIVGGLTGVGVSNFDEVTAEDVVVESTGQRVGGFGGSMQSISISDCSAEVVSVTSTAGYVGGLFGTVYGDNVTVSQLLFADSSIDGSTDVGGLIGFTTSVMDIRNMDVFSVVVGGQTRLGGLTGFQTGAARLLDVNFAYLEVVARSGGNGYVGGVSGWATALMRLENANLSNIVASSDASYVGGVSGWINGTLSMSHVVASSISATGDGYVAGVTGFSTNQIQGELVSLTDIRVSAQSDNSGGIAGQVTNADTNIRGLLVNNVQITSSAGYAGGLFGYATVGTELSIADFRDISVQAAGDYAGGLLGFGVGVLTVSHGVIMGTHVSGDENIGGLIARSIYGLQFSEVLLRNISATGSASVGNFVGLLNGDDELLAMTRSYQVESSTSSPIAGTVTGTTGSAQLAESINLSDAQLTATYLGWDFQNIWGIQCSANPKLPALRFLTNGLQANCSAPAPVVNNNSTPSTPSYVYDGPLFTSISPKVVWSGSELVLAGNQLDRISKISVDGVELVFQKLSGTEIKVQVPAGLTLGIKDLRVSYDQGTLVVGSAFEVVAKPVVPVEKLTIVNFNGRVWVYFKNFANKPLFVKVAGKWFKVANSGKEVVSFSRKLAKGKSVLVTAYASGIRLETKQIIGR